MLRNIFSENIDKFFEINHPGVEFLSWSANKEIISCHETPIKVPLELGNYYVMYCLFYWPVAVSLPCMLTKFGSVGNASRKFYENLRWIFLWDFREILFHNKFIWWWTNYGWLFVVTNRVQLVADGDRWLVN